MLIALDPGHGMSAATLGRYDPGAVSGAHQEADIVLDWCESIAPELIDRGARVWWTRRNRVDPVPTRLRATRAAHAGCNALLSIHCNAFTAASANGTEVLYRAQANEPAARSVSAALAAAIGTRDRGPKYRPTLSVLRFQGRALLVELAFISHDGDRAKLLDPAMRAAGAQAIATSFLRSLGGAR